MIRHLNLLIPILIPFTLASSEFSGPSSIDELVRLVYGDQGVIPSFSPLPSSSQVAVESNDTATLKIWDLKISHYPLKKGRVTFWLENKVTDVIPKNSRMELVSYIKDELFYNGSVTICDYLTFANLNCPVAADKERKTTKHVLQVPEQAGDGRLSFISKVTDPNGNLIVHVAGIIDLKNDGTVAKEEDDYIQHDEL